MENATPVNSSGITEKISQAKSKVSVCIPTFKRTILLKKLLESINGQLLPAGIDIEIIVVDNDSERTSEAAVKEFSSQNCQYQCKYFSQPEKNISLTRNLAVKESSGDFILFIDDDNFATPTLIKEHLDTLQKYNADLVIGEVQPYFHDLTPKWLKDPSFYYSPMDETGTDARHLWASNTLIKASVINKFSDPFDIRFGISGGEDTFFFSKLRKEGYKLINSREAVSIEFIPPERTTHKYLFKRFFKGGNAFVLRRVEQNKSTRLLIYLEQFFKASVQIIFYGLLFIPLLFSKKQRLKCLLKIYANLGKLVALNGKLYKWY